MKFSEKKWLDLNYAIHICKCGNISLDVSWSRQTELFQIKNSVKLTLCITIKHGYYICSDIFMMNVLTSECRNFSSMKKEAGIWIFKYITQIRILWHEDGKFYTARLFSFSQIRLCQQTFCKPVSPKCHWLVTPTITHYYLKDSTHIVMCLKRC